MNRCPASRTVLVIALSFGTTACSATPPAPPGTPAASPEFPPNDRVEMTPADQSLAVAEMTRLGVPAPDKNWTPNQLAEASAVLGKLAAEHPEQLPRYRSPNSGAVFARLTDVTAIDAVRDQTRSPSERIQDTGHAIDALNPLYKLYFSAAVHGKTGWTEVMELAGYVLRWAVAGELTGREFLKTIPEADRTYPVRKKAVEGLTNDIGTMVSGIMVMISDKDKRYMEDCRRLLVTMRETLPAVLPRMTKEFKTALADYLGKMMSDPGFASIQKELQALAGAVSVGSAP